MRYCDSEECSGLDPCEACSQVRRAVLMRAVKDAGLGKDEAQRFFRAYADAFDLAISEIRKAAEAVGQKRLEEKEAREKHVSKEKEGRDRRKAGPEVSKVSPLRKAVAARQLPLSPAPNGQVNKEAGAAPSLADKEQHSHKE